MRTRFRNRKFSFRQIRKVGFVSVGMAGWDTHGNEKHPGVKNGTNVVAGRSMVGQSTSRAEEPATEPVRMSHLLGTILHTMFDLGEVRVQRGLPGELLTLTDAAQPIRELV